MYFDDDDEEEEATEELISWLEADWTREALGMSKADFARMMGIEYNVLYQGLKKPHTFLKPQAAVLLRLGVNRRQAKS